MTEQQVQQREEQFTIEEVATWNDEKCEQLKGAISFTLTNVRDVAREFVQTKQSLQTLRAVLFKGLLRGYTVKCPSCNETYNVSVSDFNRESEVVCPLCGKAHKQEDNIINIVVNDETPMEKPKKKRASKKKVAKV